MQKVLESIYEPIFLGCSYGFRPGRGCHDAIRELRNYLHEKEVRVVIDVDIANYFGTIDHRKLEDMLRGKIKDERFIRYMIRMFKAGVLADGELSVSEEGVPQGSPCSPVLANIYAHHVIDTWFEETVKRHCNGKAELFRYCDDAVICCEHEDDAVRIRRALSKRLAKYGLRLNEEKTKLVRFSRNGVDEGRKQGTFDFLGFTYYWGCSRKGYTVPMIKTSGKRFRTKLKRVNEWAKKVRSTMRLKEIWKVFCIKLEGHIRYFGVTFNTTSVGRFCDLAMEILFKWLNRRSQRKSFDWEKYKEFIRKNPLPRVRVYHTLFPRHIAA